MATVTTALLVLSVFLCCAEVLTFQAVKYENGFQTAGHRRRGKWEEQRVGQSMYPQAQFRSPMNAMAANSSIFNG